MIVDRLDPALRQCAASRTDLSASVLGVVRDSLNQRRAEASRDVNTVGVDIENREARSIPVRIYRGGPAPATGDLLPLRGFRAGQSRHRSPPVCGVRATRALHGDLGRLSVGAGRPRVRLATPGLGNQSAAVRATGHGAEAGAASRRQFSRDGGVVGVDVGGIDHSEEGVR
jgi:hypothetical protein